MSRFSTFAKQVSSLLRKLQYPIFCESNTTFVITTTYQPDSSFANSRQSKLITVRWKALFAISRRHCCCCCCQLVGVSLCCIYIYRCVNNIIRWMIERVKLGKAIIDRCKRQCQRANDASHCLSCSGKPKILAKGTFKCLFAWLATIHITASSNNSQL